MRWILPKACARLKEVFGRLIYSIGGRASELTTHSQQMPGFDFQILVDERRGHIFGEHVQ